MRALHWDTKLSLSLCQLTLSLELLELLDELLEDWGTSTVVVLPDSVWKVWPSLWAASWSAAWASASCSACSSAICCCSASRAATAESSAS